MKVSKLNRRPESSSRMGRYWRTRALAVVFALLLVAALVSSMFVNPALPVSAAGTSSEINLNKTPVPDFNVNVGKYALRPPTAAQLQALDALKQNLGDSNITARWDKTSGSIDTIFDFSSQPSSLDPESAARAFIQQNAGLFGISDLNTLRLKSNTEALGGNLLYFEQTYNGIPVAGRGIGLMLDGERRVKMVSGPYEKNLQLTTTPGIEGATAVAKAQADLANFKVQWAQGVAEKLTPALDTLQAQLGAFATPRPHLNIFPTAGGARLVWKFYVFSRNPFGFFKYYVDASSGEVLYREDTIHYQQDEALPLKADVYPTYPCVTPELKDQGIISADPADPSKPCGQLRVQLRKFDATNAATGVNGTLTGTHAHIENVLPVKLPFGQAAKGTWYFRENNAANLEQRTYEKEHYGPNAEPAEHQDGISQYFYITSLVEYIDYLHRAGDAKHSRVGQGDFPDTYPNQSSPLIGNVHMPNVLNPPTNPADPTFLDKLLGLDNAFSVSASSREVLGEDVAGQNVVVNPTSYGHGYLLNDLAIDFAVPYHEGMHSISSPIAGLENDADGAPEGSALNEAQADLWAYTAGENPVLGHYPLNGFVYRNAVRANGGNPDLRQWIRHADSGLKYSQIGTEGGSSYEEHRDGEIFAAAGWDLRQLMLMYETGGPYVRPELISGAPTVQISRGKESWERILLGAIYVLSAFNPDTMVRARDALIIADQSLYPADPSDPDTVGQHRALIEQVFAARELGVNAAKPNAEGRQTISTRVSDFAASQGKLSAPQGVTVSLASPTSAKVEWQPVSGAFAYEILKREIGKENKRQNAPVPGREYFDGDSSTDGYIHVEYVGGDQTSYTDNGMIEGVFVPRGLKNPVNSEYVVRALNVNSNRQVGVSDNSAAASVPTAVMDVTGSVQIANSNVVFAGGKTELDQTIKNLGAGNFDGTLYQPVEFRIVSISNSSVTVANADNGGKGTSTDPASFYYRQTLLRNQTSTARHLVFSNPNTALFTFDAVVRARVQVDPSQATRYEPEPNFDANFITQKFSETFSGIVPASDTGVQLVGGVTYVDVPFTSKDGAFAVTGAMTSTLGVDLDLELRDAAGNVVSSAATESPNETLTASIKPKANYFYRVIGWAGAAQDFKIVSTQSLRVPRTSSTSTGGGGSVTGDTGVITLTNLVRFTVNPVTRSVSAQIIR